MSEAIYYEAPRRAERGGRGYRSRPDSGSKALKAALFVIALAIAAELCFSTLVAPKLVIGNLDLKLGPGLNADYVLSESGLAKGLPYFSVDPERARRALESSPLVAKADVSLAFPDTVVISAEPRVPVVIVLADAADGSAGTKALVVDATGVVMREASGEELGSLPVLSGLSFKGDPAGARLPDQVSSILAEVGAVRKSAPELLAGFSEIKVCAKNWGGYELLLYPEASRIRVRSSARLNEDSLRYMMLVLDVMRTQGMEDRVSELDFRSGDIAYRLKGGSPER
jgi:cell division protein FtsQ